MLNILSGFGCLFPADDLRDALACLPLCLQLATFDKQLGDSNLRSIATDRIHETDDEGHDEEHHETPNHRIFVDPWI